MTLADALKRYLKEVTPTKRPSSQDPERRRAAILIKHLGKYSLAALTPEIIAQFRDVRLLGNDRKDKNGKPNVGRPLRPPTAPADQPLYYPYLLAFS
jgi:hypothetical protein